MSREHTIHREASGLVRVSGGKYTTYRLMARDAVDVALEGRGPVPSSQTADLPLLGAAPVAELEALARDLADESGLEAALVERLVARHGTQAREVIRFGRELDLLRRLAEEVPCLEAEVAWAIREELALGLDDVLSRRLRLSMSLRDRCESVAPRVAAIMGAELGWDARRQAEEVESYLVTARREYDVPGVEGAAADVPAAGGVAVTAA